MHQIFPTRPHGWCKNMKNWNIQKGKIFSNLVYIAVLGYNPLYKAKCTVITNLQTANFADRKFWFCRPGQGRLFCRRPQMDLLNCGFFLNYFFVFFLTVCRLLAWLVFYLYGNPWYTKLRIENFAFCRLQNWRFCSGLQNWRSAN